MNSRSLSSQIYEQFCYRNFRNFVEILQMVVNTTFSYHVVIGEQWIFFGKSYEEEFPWESVKYAPAHYQKKSFESQICEAHRISNLLAHRRRCSAAVANAAAGGWHEEKFMNENPQIQRFASLNRRLYELWFVLWSLRQCCTRMFWMFRMLSCTTLTILTFCNIRLPPSVSLRLSWARDEEMKCCFCSTQVIIIKKS